MFGYPQYPPQGGGMLSDMAMFLTWLEERKKNEEKERKEKSKKEPKWYKPEFSTLELTMILIWLSPIVAVANAAINQAAAHLLVSMITK